MNNKRCFLKGYLNPNYLFIEKNIIKVLMLFLLFTCYSCDINHQKLTIVNKTSSPIYYTLLTDTILNIDLHLYTVPANDSVKPNFVMGGKGAWEYKINNDGLDSALYIFFFKTKQLTDSIILKKKYRCYRLRVNDLDSMNWALNYSEQF